MGGYRNKKKSAYNILMALFVGMPKYSNIPSTTHYTYLGNS